MVTLLSGGTSLAVVETREAVVVALWQNVAKRGHTSQRAQP